MITLVVMNEPSAQIEVSKYLSLKELGLHNEMADCGSKAGNVQDEPRTSCYSRKQGSYQRLMKPCQKNKEANLMCSQLAKMEQRLSVSEDWNTL